MIDLQVPRRRIGKTRKSFSCKGAKVWNDIPDDIRNVESAALFTKQVRNSCFANETLGTLLKHDLLEEQYDFRYIFFMD